MSNTEYIEVVGTAQHDPAVEAYRARIEFILRARRNRSALDESLATRRRVIDALKEAGVEQNDIQEAGGSIDSMYWSKKRISQSLLVRASDIKVLARAMSLVEPLCSGSKYDLSFQFVAPSFAKSQNLYLETLKQALADARSKAEALAEEAAVTLGEIISIVETRPVEVRRSQKTWELDFCEANIDALAEATPYTPTEPIPSPRHVSCRVRFAVSPIHDAPQPVSAEPRLTDQ